MFVGVPSSGFTRGLSGERKPHIFRLKTQQKHLNATDTTLTFLPYKRKSSDTFIFSVVLEVFYSFLSFYGCFFAALDPPCWV